MVETQIHQLWLGFPESHASAIKHAVITIEKTIGPMKKYLQVKTVSTAKQMARPQLVPCTTAKVSGSRPLSCQAKEAANIRSIEMKRPKPKQKSQKVRLNPWIWK